MNHSAAILLAKEKMKDFGLTDKGWKLCIDKRPKTRLGQCRYTPKEIGLSSILLKTQDPEQILDTILHEIAHALVGPGHGHNEVWREMAQTVGAKPDRCATGFDIDESSFKWILVCSKCRKHLAKRHKASRKAASRWRTKCCKSLVEFIPNN